MWWRRPPMHLGLAPTVALPDDSAPRAVLQRRYPSVRQCLPHQPRSCAVRLIYPVSAACWARGATPWRALCVNMAVQNNVDPIPWGAFTPVSDARIHGRLFIVASALTLPLACLRCPCSCRLGVQLKNFFRQPKAFAGWPAVVCCWPWPLVDRPPQTLVQRLVERPKVRQARPVRAAHLQLKWVW